MVETDDRAGVLFDHRGAKARGRAIDCFALIEPIQIRFARVEPETLRDAGGLCTATVDWRWLDH